LLKKVKQQTIMATYAQLQHADKNAEKIDDNGTRASYMFASEMPRHVESADVFPSLYDPDQGLVITNQKVTYARPDQQARMVQPIGSEIRILALCKGTEDDARRTAAAIHESTTMANLPMAPVMVEATNLYMVFRRGAPRNVQSDETLGANIIMFAIRMKHLKEAEQKADVRMEKRPERPAIVMPESTQELYPQADQFRTNMAESERLRKFNALVKMSTDPSNSKKFQAAAKKRLRALKEDKNTLQKRLSEQDPYVKAHRQKWAAVSYVFSPQYYTIDERRFLNQPAVSPEDMCPEKIFTESDFDEAMCVQVIRAFETFEECRKFVNNKAKHDRDFSFVEVIEMGRFFQLEYLITQAHARTVPRSYQIDRLNEVIIDREQMQQAAQALAAERPDIVRQQVVQPDGSVAFTETKNNVEIVPVTSDDQVVENPSKLATPEQVDQPNTYVEEGQGGGGGSKTDQIEAPATFESTSDASTTTTFESTSDASTTTTFESTSDASTTTLDSTHGANTTTSLESEGV
jgi:hypothetical protein